MNCELETEWSPTSIEDARDWKNHLNCSNHLWNIVTSSFTNSDLLIEIIKGAEFRDYFSYQAMLWLNPNLDERILGWLDGETANWPVKEAFLYWQERSSAKIGPHVLSKSPLTGAPSALSFSDAILSEELDDLQSALEVLRVAYPLVQQLWHDLSEQGICDLQYREDSISGSTFRAYMPQPELDVPEAVLDALSGGYFTDWISHDMEIDEYYARDELLSRIEDDGFRDGDDTIEDYTLCKALVFGSDAGDLEITGDLQKYLVESGLFGESDFYYPVKVESEPDWEGNRFRDLTPDQQVNLVRNITKSMSHSLLGREMGIAVHLLVCIVLNSDTNTAVHSFLREKTLGDEVTFALDYVETN